MRVHSLPGFWALLLTMLIGTMWFSTDCPRAIGWSGVSWAWSSLPCTLAVRASQVPAAPGALGPLGPLGCVGRLVGVGRLPPFSVPGAFTIGFLPIANFLVDISQSDKCLPGFSLITFNSSLCFAHQEKSLPGFIPITILPIYWRIFTHHNFWCQRIAHQTR